MRIFASPDLKQPGECPNLLRDIFAYAWIKDKTKDMTGWEIIDAVGRAISKARTNDHEPFAIFLNSMDLQSVQEVQDMGAGQFTSEMYGIPVWGVGIFIMLNEPTEESMLYAQVTRHPIGGTSEIIQHWQTYPLETTQPTPERNDN